MKDFLRLSIFAKLGLIRVFARVWDNGFYLDKSMPREPTHYHECIG
jgi:hypothetical protein